jgi:hypothetical protein
MLMMRKTDRDTAADIPIAAENRFCAETRGFFLAARVSSLTP